MDSSFYSMHLLIDVLIAAAILFLLFNIDLSEVVYLTFLYPLELAYLRFLLPFPTNPIPLPGTIIDFPLYLYEALIFNSSLTSPSPKPADGKQKIRVQFPSDNASSDSDTNSPQTPVVTKRTLVVLSGDATDADGCIELAQIAKSGADILYIMHLSQPFGVLSDVVKFEEVAEDVKKLKLPFLENGKEFNKKVPSDDYSYNYGTMGKADDLIKRSQHAFRKVFEENQGSNASKKPSKFFFRYKSKDGRYYYNKRNPFGFIWKSEMSTFNESFDEPSEKLKLSDNLPNLDDYTEVILDLSGSSAFWGTDVDLKKFLLKAQQSGLLKYVVMMGGVETSEPKTLVLPALMIRHPLATMNQLYDAESFFDMASQLFDGPRWVVVSNNIVNRVADYTKMKSKDEFISFIVEKVVKSTRDTSPMLVKVIESFYQENEKFKWKLYDCLTGKIIYDHVKGKAALSSINPDYKLDGKRVSNSLFTEPKFGATIVGPQSVLHDYLTKEALKDLVSERKILDDVIVPYFTKEWFVDLHKEKKTLVVVSGGAHDASEAVALAQIAKSGADVLYVLQLSQPFGVKKGAEFERSVKEVDDAAGNAELAVKARMFKKKVRHDPKDDSISYEYRTNKKAEDVIRRCQHAFTKIFEENKHSDYNVTQPSQLLFRYAIANTKPAGNRTPKKSKSKSVGAYFINKKNLIGYLWKSELEVMDESFNNPLKDSAALPDLDDYTEVILNLSGSCAFWGIDLELQSFLLDAQKRGLLQYVVVTGGIETETEEPPTHDKDLVTKHLYATVNHAWDPDSFADIAAQLSKHTRWVVVPNSAANKSTDYSVISDKGGIVPFILEEVVKSTIEASPTLVKVVEKNSSSEWQPRSSLAAKIIYDHVKERAALSTINSKRWAATDIGLLTESKYGVTMVGSPPDLKQFFQDKQLSYEESKVVHKVIVPYFAKNWYVETRKKTLVVVSGGAIHGDSFIELAQIAKSGADILYVMHMSQPFGNPDGVKFEKVVAKVKGPDSNAGRVFNELVGFNAGDNSYLYGTEKKAEDLISRCQHAFREIFEQSKKANMAKNSSKFIFRCRNGRGEYFYNKRNPFGLIWKPETATFNESFDFSDRNLVRDSEALPDLLEYSQVILDISCSSTFWSVDSDLKDFLLKAQEQRLLKYVVVMGSIETSVEPPRLFNMDYMTARHPMATTTQAFDPVSFADIATQLCDARWVVVPNNLSRRVADCTGLPSKEEFVSFIVDKILLSSREDSPMLVRVIEAFYSEQEKFNWKLYNCLTGKIIYDHVKGKAELSNLMSNDTTFEKLELFTEPMHGVTIVGPQSVLDKYLTDSPGISKRDKVKVQDVIVPPFDKGNDKEWYIEKFHPYNDRVSTGDSKIKQQVQEFLFPVSYLIDEVEETDGAANRSRCYFGVKYGQQDLVSPNSMVQRMMLITAKALKFEFGFARNFGVDKDFKHLASFRLVNETEVVSNIEPGALVDKLEVELDPAFAYFNFIRVQCLTSKRRNQRHICYLEVSATNATAKYTTVADGVDSTVILPATSKWFIGKELQQFEDMAGKVSVYTPEIIRGPLVFTGVGVDLFSGFLFQLSSLVEKPPPSLLRRKIKRLHGESFYDQKARLASSGITDYVFFESPKFNQTGYREIFQSVTAVRKDFRELAVEDKEAPILFQRLNRSYLELTSNPISIVLPSMIQLLEKSLAEEKIGLIQSVIRINHLEAKYTHHTVRKVWSTFTESITLVKKFVLLRSELNVFECAILLDSYWKKSIALSVVMAQILSYAALANYVYYHQCAADSTGAPMQCFWRVRMAAPISMISAFLTFIKVFHQTKRKYKFEAIFKGTIKLTKLNRFLLLIDFISNVVMGFFSVILCFVLISRSDNVLDVVLNALAVASISELDEELGAVLDEDGDAVEEFFKSHLKENMKIVSDEIDCDLATSERALNSSYLLDMLVRANYSPNPYTDGENVTDRIRVFIENRCNRFMVTDDNLGSQRAQDRTTDYLVLHFKYGISFCLKEQSVVYFSDIENILKSRC